VRSLNHDEEKILKELINGDNSAYVRLIDLYYKDLCNYATSLARDDFKSEDIVQSVIIRLWEKRKRLDPSISIKKYLYRSVYNEFIDTYRKARSVSAVERKYIEKLDSIIENEEDENSKRLIKEIKKLADELPPKCKETFWLSKESGLTYKEIADYQNVSVNTVEKQMVKAISYLRKKLSNYKWVLLIALVVKI